MFRRGYSHAGWFERLTVTLEGRLDVSGEVSIYDCCRVRRRPGERLRNRIFRGAQAVEYLLEASDSLSLRDVALSFHDDLIELPCSPSRGWWAILRRQFCRAAASRDAGRCVPGNPGAKIAGGFGLSGKFCKF